MPALKLRLIRLASVSVLLLLSLSLTVVVVHQCHAYVTHDSNMDSISVAGFSSAQESNSSNSLVRDVCIGTLFLILLFGRKDFIKTKFYPLISFNQLNSWRGIYFARPPNRRSRLTILQLGVIRI